MMRDGHVLQSETTAVVLMFENVCLYLPKLVKSISNGIFTYKEPVQDLLLEDDTVNVPGLTVLSKS